jgi:hypothetical protein
VPRKRYIQPEEKDVLIANTYKIDTGPASFWKRTTTIPKEPIRENIAKVELPPDLRSWKDSLSTICF